MIYVIGYVVIGLIFAGIVFPFGQKAVEREVKTDEEKAIVFLVGLVFVLFLMAPFWPMWLVLFATKPFRKRKRGEMENG